MTLLVAIDDTDNKSSIGTGRLSRMLAGELVRRGFLKDCRVTRHQLLIHPDIPYTSHNSSACIEATLCRGTLDEVFQLSRAFLGNHFHEGANPGLCVMDMDDVPGELSDFGKRAQHSVIPLAEGKAFALSLAKDKPTIWWGGETGRGCIGALAAVGLRRTGNDGTYIDLKGIRDVTGMITVERLLRRTAIDRVTDLQGRDLHPEALIDSQDWVRPRLKDHLVVLELIPVDGHWRATHKKKEKKSP